MLLNRALSSRQDNTSSRKIHHSFSRNLTREKRIPNVIVKSSHACVRESLRRQVARTTRALLMHDSDADYWLQILTINITITRVSLRIPLENWIKVKKQPASLSSTIFHPLLSICMFPPRGAVKETLVALKFSVHFLWSIYLALAHLWIIFVVQIQDL